MSSLRIASLIFLFSVSSFGSDAWADQKILSTVKTIVEEVRPKASTKELADFLNSSPMITKDQSLEKSAKQITEYIFTQWKISADTSYQSRNSKDNILPDGVLAAKKGHCVGLTTLFLLVAEKHNLKAQLVRGPDHVFPRLCAANKCINVEMLKEGEIKEDDYYIRNLLITKQALDKKNYLVGLESPEELKASLYLSLGFIANKVGDKEQAKLFYLKAIQSSDNFAEPHSNLAALYADSGRSEEALKELKIALEINPSHYATLINLGILEQSAGQTEKALEYYDKALAANPISADGYRKRANLYNLKKDWKNAALDLDRVLIVQPKFCDVIEDRIEIAKKSPQLANDKLPKQLKQLKSDNTCLYLPLK